MAEKDEERRAVAPAQVTTQDVAKAEKDEERRAVAPAQVTTQDVAKALADLTRAPEGPTGPNATTDPEDPKEHYFLASDGKTKVNAFGEEKGSAADKKRMATW